MPSPADTLLAQLDPDRIPAHVAIIMDGNGRWARERGLERRDGHRAGVQSVSRIVRAAARCGIRYLTLYTFSTENWRRPKAEVDALMTLLVRSAVEELATLEENNVRLRTIGDLEGLPEEPREALMGLVESTKSNTGITLVLAVNYSSRSELTRAFNRLLAERHGSEEPITPQDICAHLDLPDLPDPDLLIRTGGGVSGQQLPPLAACLYRALLLRLLLARLRSCRPLPSPYRLPVSPATLRSHRRSGG